MAIHLIFHRIILYSEIKHCAFRQTAELWNFECKRTYPIFAEILFNSRTFDIWIWLWRIIHCHLPNCVQLRCGVFWPITEYLCVVHLEQYIPISSLWENSRCGCVKSCGPVICRFICVIHRYIKQLTIIIGGRVNNIVGDFDWKIGFLQYAPVLISVWYLALVKWTNHRNYFDDAPTLTVLGQEI